MLCVAWICLQLFDLFEFRGAPVSLPEITRRGTESGGDFRLPAGEGPPHEVPTLYDGLS
jgi:hypothetical protein